MGDALAARLPDNPALESAGGRPDDRGGGASGERHSGGGVRLGGEAPGLVRWAGTVADCPFGVAIRLEVTNTSGRPLAGVGASPCFQLAAAPDFRDF
ncbi:MAG: hypothetical protein AB1505_36510, partial [Candidatus Latescibacterota bacterium]